MRLAAPAPVAGRASGERAGIGAAYAPLVDDLEGLLLGLTAALAWGLTDTIATFASRRIGSMRATAGTLLTSVVVLVALLLASGQPLPDDPVVVVTALACGALAGLAYLAFFTALRHGPISVVSPVAASYGGLTVVLSVLVLGESLDPAQALGVVVATTGILLASIVFDRRLRSARPIGLGVAYAVVARTANVGTVWLILGASRLHRAPTPASADARPLDRRALGLVVAAGLLDIGGFIAFAVGLEIAPTWLIGITSSFGPVIAVTAGILLFAERPRPVQWLGLALVATSVFLIALG
jgi:drug/metabolite transporter (DMT)-like permease